MFSKEFTVRGSPKVARRTSDRKYNEALKRFSTSAPDPSPRSRRAPYSVSCVSITPLIYAESYSSLPYVANQCLSYFVRWFLGYQVTIKCLLNA
jgi:hypothetical protein